MADMGRLPNVPGVTYSPIRPATQPNRVDTTLRPLTPRNSNTYEDNLALITEYENSQYSVEEREKAKEKKKQPLWKRAAKTAANIAKYSSVSELATKLPGVGDDIERGMDYVPGVRTALAVATNPLTYATGGVGGAAAAAAGAGLGTWAVSNRNRGLGLNIPFVPEQYEETVGGVAGGLAGGAAAARVSAMRNAAAARSAAANLERMDSGVVQADDILYTADRGKTFTARQPTAANPLEWHSVRVKTPENLVWNAEEGQYVLRQDVADAMDILANKRVATTNKFDELVDGNEVFDVVQAPTKAAERNFFEKIGDRVDATVDRLPEPVPGFRKIYRGARSVDKAVGNAAASLLPDAVQPVASTLLRPSTIAGAYAIANPDKVKAAIKKGLEIDHAIGLKTAQTLLPHWELDVNVPDWLPGVGDSVELDVEGIGAELFRPTNFIDFTPAGTALKAGMVLRGGARMAGLKALGEIAIREGAGNAVFGGLDAWSQGADTKGILESMGIAFLAGAGLGVPLNVGMPVVQHHIGKMLDVVRKAPDENEAAKALLTMQKNLEEADPEARAEITPEEQQTVDDLIKGEIGDVVTANKRVGESLDTHNVWEIREEPIPTSVAGVPETKGFNIYRDGEQYIGKDGQPYIFATQEDANIFLDKMKREEPQHTHIREQSDTPNARVSDSNLSVFHIQKYMPDEIRQLAVEHRNSLPETVSTVSHYTDQRVERSLPREVPKAWFDRSRLVEVQMNKDGTLHRYLVRGRSPLNTHKDLTVVISADTPEPQIVTGWLNDINDIQRLNGPSSQRYEVRRNGEEHPIVTLLRSESRQNVPQRPTSQAPEGGRPNARTLGEALDEGGAIHDRGMELKSELETKPVSARVQLLHNQNQFEILVDDISHAKFDNYPDATAELDRVADTVSSNSLPDSHYYRVAQKEAGLDLSDLPPVPEPETPDASSIFENTIHPQGFRDRLERLYTELNQKSMDERVKVEQTSSGSWAVKVDGITTDSYSYSRDAAEDVARRWKEQYLLYPDMSRSHYVDVLKKEMLPTWENSAPAEERTGIRGRFHVQDLRSGSRAILNVLSGELTLPDYVKDAAFYATQYRGVPKIEQLLSDGEFQRLIGEIVGTQGYYEDVGPEILPTAIKRLIDSSEGERVNYNGEIFDEYDINDVLDTLEYASRAEAYGQPHRATNLIRYAPDIIAMRGIPAIEHALQTQDFYEIVRPHLNYVSTPEQNIQNTLDPDWRPEPSREITPRHPRELRTNEQGQELSARTINETVSKIERIQDTAISEGDVQVARDLWLIRQNRGVPIIDETVILHANDLARVAERLDFDNNPDLIRPDDSVDTAAAMDAIKSAEEARSRGYWGHFSSSIAHVARLSLEPRVREAIAFTKLDDEYRAWRWSQENIDGPDFNAALTGVSRLESASVKDAWQTVNDILEDGHGPENSAEWAHVSSIVEPLRNHPQMQKILAEGDGAYDRFMQQATQREGFKHDMFTQQPLTSEQAQTDLDNYISRSDELVDEEWEFVDPAEARTIFRNIYGSGLYDEFKDFLDNNLAEAVQRDVDKMVSVRRAKRIIERVNEFIADYYNWDEDAVDSLRSDVDSQLPNGMYVEDHPDFDQNEYENIRDNWQQLQDEREEDWRREQEEEDEEDYYRSRITDNIDIPEGFNSEISGSELRVFVGPYHIDLDSRGGIVLGTTGVYAGMSGRTTKGNPGANFSDYDLALNFFKQLVDNNPHVDFHNSPADAHRARAYNRLFGFEPAHYPSTQFINRERLNKIWERHQRVNRKSASTEDVPNARVSGTEYDAYVSSVEADLQLTFGEDANRRLSTVGDKLREAVLSRKRGNDSTFGEYVKTISDVEITALDKSNTVVAGTDIKVAADPDIYSQRVIDFLANTNFAREFADAANNAVETVKNVIRRTRWATEDVENTKFSGFWMEPIVKKDGSNESVLGIYLMPHDGRRAVAIDPISHIRHADTFLRGKADLEPPEQAFLDKHYPNGISLKELSGLLATGTVWHEMTHGVHVDHGVTFYQILDEIHERSPREFRMMVGEFQQVFDNLSKNETELKALEGAIDDTDAGIDEYIRRVIESRKQTGSQYGLDTRRQGELGKDAAIDDGSGTARQTTGLGDDSRLLLSDEEGGGELGNGVEPSPEDSSRTVEAGTNGSGEGSGGMGGTTATGSPAPEPEPNRPKRRIVNRVGPDGQRLDKSGMPSKKAPIASQTVATSTKPEPLESTPDFEVISDNWQTNLNGAKIKDAGAGAAFLRSGGQARRANATKTRVVQELSSVDDVVENNFKNNWMKRLAEKFPKIGRYIGGLAAVAKEPWEKTVLAYHILREEGESRKFITLNMLRQDQMPFAEVVSKGDGAPTGKIHVNGIDGSELVANLGDVFSNPSRYELTPEQKGYVTTVHKIIDDLVDEMRTNGVDIKELGIEKRGEHYFPRMVKGKDGFLLEDILSYDKPYASRSLGSKQPFQKGRVYETMAEGEAAGVIYAPALEALEGFVDAANKTIAARKVLDALSKYGITAKELALEQVGYIEITGKNGRPTRKVASSIYGAVAEVSKAKKQLDAARKSMRDVQKRIKQSQTGRNRKLSMRELTSMANDDPEIKGLRHSIEDAKAQQKYDKFLREITPEERETLKAYQRAKMQYKSLLRHSPQDAINFTEKGRPVVTRINKEGRVTSAPDKYTRLVKKEDLEAAAKRVEDLRAETAKIYKSHNRENIEVLGDRLKERMAQKRREIRAAHEIGRAADKSIAETGVAQQPPLEHIPGLEDARKAINEAEEYLASAKLNLQVTRSKFSATVQQKANSLTERTSLLDQDVVNELGLEGNVVPVRRVGMIPGLNGKLFPDKIADSIDAGLKDAGIDGVLRSVSDLNDKARLLKTGADIGYLFIQGLPVLATNPVAWSKSAYRAIEALFNPEGYARWIESKKALVNRAYPYIGGFSGSEYFSAAPGTSFIKKWSQLHVSPGDPRTMILNAPRKGSGKVMERAAVSFEAFLDASKIMLWESMEPHMKTRTDKEAYGRLIRNLTGTTSTARLGVTRRQRQIEALLLFSPRFTRSVFALISQGIESGPARKEALKSLGLMMGSAAFLYAGAKMAAYEAGFSDEPLSADDFDPTKGGRFMSIKMGNNYYGIGGSFRGVVQLAANMAAAGKNDPSRFVSLESSGIDANPFLKFLRGKTSPSAASAIDIATGKTVIGEDVSDRKAYLARLPDAYVPFIAASWMETEGSINEKLATSVGQATGFRTFPESAREDLDAKVREFANDKAVDGWSNLTANQKAIMLDRHPELQKLLDKRDAASWNDFKEADLSAQKAKRELAARWLKTQAKGGEKVTEDDLTSLEYREALKDINQKLAAAKSALTGADPITGLGGDEFAGVRNQTPRQKLLSAYYDFVDKNQYVRPDGTVDYDKKERLEAAFMEQLSPEEQKIVIEETTGTTKLDPVERRLREAQAKMRPYWELRDQIAQTFGYENALAMEQAPEGVQKRYNKVLEREQESFRSLYPDVDKLMAIWGYVSKTLDQREPGKPKRISAIKTKSPSRVKRISLF